MSQFTGLIRTLLATAVAAGMGGVFVHSDGGDSTAFIASGPYGGHARVDVTRGDGFIVIERRDDSGAKVTIIQADGRGASLDF
jgi:hypothetical protein